LNEGFPINLFVDVVSQIVEDAEEDGAPEMLVARGINKVVEMPGALCDGSEHAWIVCLDEGVLCELLGKGEE